jgi:hypothetical protein
VEKILFRLTMIGVMGMVMQAQAALVAYWDFNEGSGTVLHDRTGNGNDGTLYGAAWGTGYRGNGLFFNGTSDYVELQKPANFQLPRFTFSCWLQTADPYSPQERTFFSNVEAVSGVANGFIIRFNSNSMLNFCLARADGGGYWINLNCLVTVSASSYHFVAASYDGALMKLYFDNALVGQLSYTGGVKYSSVYPDIGAARNNSGYPGYFKGTLDEMRIYNSALSDAEIQTLYTSSPLVRTLLLYPVPSPSYNRQPVLSWHAVKDAAAYTVQIDTVKSFAKPIFSVPQTDTVFRVPADLPIDTIYWQVIAGVNDTLVYYSVLGSFVIQDPLVPILIPYEPKVTLERRPVLAWHGVAGASSYIFEAAQSSTFASPICLVPGSDTTDTIATDLPYGPIFWRVKSNLTAAWSTPDMFQVVPDSIPVLVRFNGATVSTKTPLFKWHPVSGATSYKIEIASDRAFTSGYSVPITDTVYLPAGGLANGTWYWHVSCSRNIALFCPIDSVEIASTDIRGANKNSVIATMPFLVACAGKRISIVSKRDGEGNFKAALYDMQGKGLRKAGSTGGKIVMEAPELPSGLYLLEIRSGGACIRSKVLFR